MWFHEPHAAPQPACVQAMRRFRQRQKEKVAEEASRQEQQVSELARLRSENRQLKTCLSQSKSTAPQLATSPAQVCIPGLRSKLCSNGQACILQSTCRVQQCAPAVCSWQTSWGSTKI